MVEACGAKPVPNLFREAAVVPEDNPFQERRALAAETAHDGAAKPAPERVREAAEPYAAPDDPVGAQMDDDVNALAAQPRALIEAVLRPARRVQVADALQNRPLGRRPSARELEQNVLVNLAPVEPADLRIGPDLETAGSRRSRDGDEGARCLSDVRSELAAVENVEPGASPPGTAHQQGKRHGNGPGTGEAERRDGRDTYEHKGFPRVHTHDVGKREPEAQRRCQQLRKPPGDQLVHGATTSRSCSSRAGPMPGIASSASTDPNAPCSVR